MYKISTLPKFFPPPFQSQNTHSIMASSLKSKWACAACTYFNEFSSTICAICGTSRPKETNNNEWSCPACTFNNKSTASQCQICGQQNPTQSTITKWSCQMCTFKNDQTSTTCQICNAPNIPTSWMIIYI